MTSLQTSHSTGEVTGVIHYTAPNVLATSGNLPGRLVRVNLNQWFGYLRFLTALMPWHTSLPHGPEGTIYEASGFDDDLRIEIDPTKIKFIKELKTSEASSIVQCEL
ncbi:hypothetical protein ACJ73_08077 [Blastomyces percursus]|uniref:Uncharacterized protein n=1 Tax=Blastomyces percursus TaxID=1658174 RepID=A0A1J9PW56_9EURO|nr:hypothetical protein ACJ73_08077 [Blastomyces percursus]